MAEGDGVVSGQRGAGSKDRRGHSRGYSRGRGGGRGRGGHKGKKGDLGRSEWSKQKGDKRKQNEDTQAAKRRKVENGKDGGGAAAALPIYATKFDEEELKNEERRPKKKVAVMIGYSGTGYKGMQLAPDQKTIEGDLFKAFVEAGAISKANADDPKKSSFVRCARTDKGVHAAGNVISLKLIVEDDDIVQKINAALTPQIRVWGFERTNNSFSAYQLCDSRIYEYLIPTHSFLPPHPRSYLGRKCREWAEKKDDVENWNKRQEEVLGYWEKVDEEVIKPILQDFDESVRPILEKALWLKAEKEAGSQTDVDGESKPKKPLQPTEDADEAELEFEEENETPAQKDPAGVEAAATATTTTSDHAPPNNNPDRLPLTKEERIARHKLINEGIKRLRAAYVAAKRAYRIPKSRRQRLVDTLQLYLGTRNYHNYTIQKPFHDPSAKRVIKSFVVNPIPILIGGTEWLSLKVHGQSFMMHQIRKMVGMAALIVRCGADPGTLIPASFGNVQLSIPKAPALGLLLERPVFDSYNRRAGADLGRENIDFDKFRAEMDAFKQEYIYERMYEDEEREYVFGNFFNHVDNFPADTFLFVTSGGVEATGEMKQEQDGLSNGSSRRGAKAKEKVEDVDEDDDEDKGAQSEDEEMPGKDGAGDEG